MPSFDRPLRSLSARGLLAALALFACGSAMAQDYPTKPITIIVGFPPGGILDWMSRTLAAKLQERWGQPAVVENRVGAGGLISVQAVQKAPPDGHTILTNTQLVGQLPMFIKDATIEPGRDLQPLSPAFFAPFVLITNTQVPVKTLREFVALTKANPGKVNIGIVPNSGQHLDSLEFVRQSGANTELVPYQGGAPALRALLANEIQLYFGAAFGLDAQIKAGKIAPLAVSSAQRFAYVPDVPTIKEAIGIDFDSVVEYGYFTTQGTPRPVVDKLSREIAAIFTRPDVRDQVLKQGYEPRVKSADEWLASMNAELRRARAIAQVAGIKAQ